MASYSYDRISIRGQGSPAIADSPARCYRKTSSCFRIGWNALRLKWKTHSQRPVCNSTVFSVQTIARYELTSSIERRRRNVYQALSNAAKGSLSGPEWLVRRVDRYVEIGERFCMILFTLYLQRCIQRKVKSSQFYRRRTCSHTPSLDTSSRHQFSDVSLCVCLASSACLPISTVLARRVYRADGSQANRSPQRQVDRDVDWTEKSMAASWPIVTTCHANHGHFQQTRAHAVLTCTSETLQHLNSVTVANGRLLVTASIHVH